MLDSMPHRPLSLVVMILTLLTAVLQAQATELFPVYPCIADNVAFWEKIYGEVSSNEALLHDRDDLSKVYATITLVDRKLPLAASLNKELIKHATEEIQALLDRLASGAPAVTEEEKRIAAMFPPGDRTGPRQSRDRLRTQNGIKERFLEGVLRSGASMREMHRILAARGIPPEIAYLPHVESSFRPDAHSKAGAVGAWQFTSSTGKLYLRVDEVIDERRDVLLATDGAARYLAESYAQLGSWPLALTSYNHGRAGMVRAKAAHGDYEGVFRDFQGRSFGFASKNFYSEFVAALRVARRLEVEHASSLHAPVPHQSLGLPDFVAADDLIRHYGITRTELTRLNPALGRAVLSGERYIPKGFTLRLPLTIGKATRVAALPAALLHKEQKRDRQYRVQRGDTASKIAARYKISLKQLVHANQLDRKATVYVGQRLNIPGS